MMRRIEDTRQSPSNDSIAMRSSNRTLRTVRVLLAYQKDNTLISHDSMGLVPLHIKVFVIYAPPPYLVEIRLSVAYKKKKNVKARRVLLYYCEDL